MSRGRRRCRRWVEFLPQATSYHPNIPYNGVTTLLVEELEAIRLVDLLGMSQQEAAARMGISQKSLWNDLKNARFKIADAIINGKAIQIAGGNYILRR
ncbi:MAG: DUF134 domain-containing protein [Thermoplasmata archaeon]|nr:DUF134 domain-containing protein [Thermoplasmata archaeon]